MSQSSDCHLTHTDKPDESVQPGGATFIGSLVGSLAAVTLWYSLSFTLQCLCNVREMIGLF